MKKPPSPEEVDPIRDSGEAESKSAGSKDYLSTDHLRSGLRKRALRSTSATLVAQACSFGIQTVGTIILARLLTPHDFGLVTMVVSLSLLLQNCGGNGLVEAIIQKPELHHKQISTLFWINAGLGLMLALFFIASAPAIAWFYKEPLLTPIAAAMAVSILLGGLSNQHVALLRRNMEFYKTSTCDVAATLFSVAIAIILAYWGWGYWALVAKWIVSPFVMTVLVWIMCGWRPGLPSRGTGVRPMLRFAFNTYGNFVLGYLGKTGDKILLGRFQGSQSLGYYDRAYQLSNMLPSQLVSPLNGVAMATFSRLSSDREKYRHSYLALLSMLAFVCMPLSAAMALTGKDLVLLLLGPQWVKAGEMFIFFAFSTGIIIIYHTHGWLHLSLGTPHRWLRWGIVAFIVTMLCFIAGLPFGAAGVAVAYSASYYILIVPGIWYAGRPINLELLSILSAVWKYFASALVAGLSCWIILHKLTLISIHFVELNIFIRIVGSCSLCILIYLLMIIVFHRSAGPISQFVSLVREMIPEMSWNR